MFSRQVLSENSTSTHSNFYYDEEASKVWSAINIKTVLGVAFAIIFGVLFLMYVINLKSRRESQVKKLWV